MNFTTEEKIDILKRINEINELRAQFNGCKKSKDYATGDRLHFSVEQIGYDGTSRVYTKDFSVNQLTHPMREAVLPPKGKKFLYFDYSAAELYILAYWSNCREMLSWFDQGLDVHTEVMQRLLHKDEVTKADRAISKVLSFATCYGGNEYTISKDLHCDIDTAAKFLADYKALFPEFEQFKARMISYTHTNGCTKTIFGRYRKLQDIKSWDLNEVAKAERQAVNTAIQASCADFLKLGSVRIFNQHPEVRIAMQVFDSMLLEVDENMTDEQALEIIKCATDFSDKFPGFKFRCDWAFGSNWEDVQSKC